MKASKPLQQHKVLVQYIENFNYRYSKTNHSYLMCFLYYTLQKYPPPSVPRDFVPIHKFTVSAVKDMRDVVTQKPLTSTERTQMLADKPGICVQNVRYMLVYVV